jgi:hypothetical protein
VKSKRTGLLLVWLLGILFPMAWVRKFSLGYQHVFNAIFAPEWMHWLMHAVLYAGLAVLLVKIFTLGIKPRSVLLVCGVVLLVGILQEGIQCFSAVQVLRWNSVFDLGMDLFGAAVGLLIIWLIRKTSKMENIPAA